MKKQNNILILMIISFGVFLSSCSINNKGIIIIKTLDQFDTFDENEQLGKDLISFNYAAYLIKEFPDLSENVLKNIEWQYFIQDNNKEITFRLLLNNEALDHKKELVSFFEKIVDKQVDRQVRDRKIFKEAIKLSKISIEQLDNREYDSFWARTSDQFKNLGNKDAFFNYLISRENITTMGGQRQFAYKIFYDDFPGSNNEELYVIGYTFEKDQNLMEQLMFTQQNDSLKIFGYDFRIPNQ